MIQRALYEALQFFVMWLSQPTLIEVADGLEIEPSDSNRNAVDT
jgi:hypothetical protein